MKKIATILISALLAVAPSFAQESTQALPDSLNYELALKALEQEITLREELLNDYCSVGAYYGLSLGNTTFNPSRKTSMFVIPGTYGVAFQYHQKMFGYMPFFGFEIGVEHNYGGYQFKANKETGAISHVEGATKAIIENVEVPFLMMAHAEVGENLKLMAKIGIYGGYRLSIERFPPEGMNTVSESIRHDFLPTDNRIDYGLKGGVGFALVFSPFELHFNGQIRYSWSSLYQPDAYDPEGYGRYYWRFAYPMDIFLTVGLHYELTPRYGRSRSSLRRLAKDMVYNPEKYESK